MPALTDCATRTGRRPEAFSEGTRGKWGTLVPLALWGFGRDASCRCRWCNGHRHDGRRCSEGLEPWNWRGRLDRTA